MAHLVKQDTQHLVNMLVNAGGSAVYWLWIQTDTHSMNLLVNHTPSHFCCDTNAAPVMEHPMPKIQVTSSISEYQTPEEIFVENIGITANALSSRHPVRLLVIVLEQVKLQDRMCLIIVESRSGNIIFYLIDKIDVVDRAGLHRTIRRIRSATARKRESIISTQGWSKVASGEYIHFVGIRKSLETTESKAMV